MKKLELQIGYIADAIIDVKSERFDERFVSIKELLIIKKIMELRLKEKQLMVSFVDTLFDNYFRVDNDVITKTEGKTLKMYICDEQIRETIYDNELIYDCLCKILISKLENSIEHTCSTCFHNCEEFPDMADKNTCCGWKHNFEEHCLWNLSSEERQLIEDSQSQEAPVQKLVKNIAKQV